MEEPIEEHVYYCSFCFKSYGEVGLLFHNIKSNAYICEGCTDRLSNKFQEKVKKDTVKKILKKVENFSSPLVLKNKLLELIVGQDKAMTSLALSVYNHYRRVFCGNNSDLKYKKSNIILLGPTGVGKTYSIEVLAEILKVPFCIADANQFTEAGYYGDDVEEMIITLLRAANNNVNLAQCGIIYIDEIDKLRKQSNRGRDVSGSGVQMALLKLIEGKKIHVPLKGVYKKSAEELVEIDTSNILFVCGGAFVGLEEIILARKKSTGIGFGADINKINDTTMGSIFEEANTSDFIKYGLIPELVGRLPKKVNFRGLKEEDLVRILTEPQSAIIKEYEEIFENHGIKLLFEPEALKAIARLALKENIGARGLRRILEDKLEPIMFSCFSNLNIKDDLIIRSIISCVITENVITSDKPPELKEEEIIYFSN